MTTATIAQKTCSACKCSKALDDFSADAGNADGKRRRCKQCVKESRDAAAAEREVQQTTEASGEQFMQLPIGQVVTSLTNPRQTFDEAKLKELAASIEASGVHQPILVRALPIARVDETSRGRDRRPAWEIVAGERRYRASKMAGKDIIPAMVKQLTDEQVLEIQIVENLQRDDLTELEEAEGYQRLVERTGTAKEDIGAKIGRSRSYVYQRLKLLDLDTSGREAMRAGKLDASKALLIARIPDSKQQIKALGQATGEANYGRGLPVKELQAWIQTNVMLSLKRTKFDIKDATLCPEAGACPGCPKRTGADPDLFADVDSPDLCIDPSCYRSKEKAHDDRRFEEAQREGKKVIEPEKVEKLAVAMPSHDSRWLDGYYDLDAYPPYQLDVDGNSLRKALGKHCPEPTLVKHPKTEKLHEVLPVTAVKRLIEQHGLTREAKRQARMGEDKKHAARLPIEERREFKERWTHQVLKATDAQLRTMTTIPPELLRAWFVDQLDSYESGAFGPALGLGEEFNEDEAEKLILAMPEADLPALMLRYLLWNMEDHHRAWSDDAERQQGPRTTLFELIHMASVDVKREMEGEDRALDLEAEEEKKRNAQKSPAPPAAGGGMTRDKSKSRKGSAAKAPAAPKTSTAEAQMHIAAALQAAEGEQNQAANAAESSNPAALAAGQRPPEAWPFPGLVLKPGVAAAVASVDTAAQAAPTFSLGAIVRVKAVSKADAKVAGKVGRIAGIAEDGRVHLRYGPKPRDLVVLQPASLETYDAQKHLLPGSKVRVVDPGPGSEQEEFMWLTGEARMLTPEGWVVTFPDESLSNFEPSQLEVLA